MFDFDATLPLMAVQFLLLAAVLNLVFYKPLTKVLDERDDYIRKNELGARERLAKAEQLTKQYEQQLAETRRQSQTLIANAQVEAEKIYEQKIAEAQQEAQGKIQEAQQEIEQQKQEALQSLEQQVDALSRQILEKIVGSQLVK